MLECQKLKMYVGPLWRAEYSKCRHMMTVGFKVLNIVIVMIQVVRVTLTRPSWHRSDMVQWLVSCATELGYEALISLMKSWYTLFTPAEATSQFLFICPRFIFHVIYQVTGINRNGDLHSCPSSSRVSNTPGNPGYLLEISKVSWKFFG